MKLARVPLYARVSTAGQSTDNQLIDLRRFADLRGWLQLKEYVDHGVSGMRGNRPALDQLMVDARKRKFDVVLVWKFDRFARSAQHLLNALADFKALDIDFCSVQDAIDTTTAYGRAMFAIVAAMAELERDLIRERVIRG